MRPVAGSVRSEVPRPELDPPRRSLCNLNEPAPSLATLGYLHGPLRRVPDRCMGDTIACHAKSQRPHRTTDGTRQDAWTSYPGAFSKASLRCPLVPKKDPWRLGPSGGMHQRRTVGLGIPCPVARLQSRTPLPQAQGVEPAVREAQGEQATVRLGTPARTQSAARDALDKDASMHAGRMPLKSQQKDSGVPVESALDFFLLIGAAVRQTDEP